MKFSDEVAVILKKEVEVVFDGDMNGNGKVETGETASLIASVKEELCGGIYRIRVNMTNEADCNMNLYAVDSDVMDIVNNGDLTFSEQSKGDSTRRPFRRYPAKEYEFTSLKKTGQRRRGKYRKATLFLGNVYAFD